MREIVSNSERDTELAGERFGASVPDGAVVAMYGELGSGKTAFVRGMARGMGIDCRVSSPTFTIVNEYLGARELIHFDMYRLASADELWDIGWEDYLDRGGLCVVEWSERVSGALEAPVTVTIEKSPHGENQRKITIEGVPYADFSL